MPERTTPDALIVFAKVPEPGKVKTRLTEVLTDAQAAALYEAFLLDALAQYQALDADVRLYLAPPVDVLGATFVPPGVTVHQQAGNGLGARMEHAFDETFAAGYHRAVVIGTDHPTLPTPFVQLAFDALVDERAVVVGPSDDGGYYLLGMNEHIPHLFAGMQYSHARVFDETLRRASDVDAAITVLPPWYDVDTPDDLAQLEADLRKTTLGAEHTRRAMGRLVVSNDAVD